MIIRNQNSLFNSLKSEYSNITPLDITDIIDNNLSDFYTTRNRRGIIFLMQKPLSESLTNINDDFAHTPITSDNSNYFLQPAIKVVTVGREYFAQRLSIKNIINANNAIRLKPYFTSDSLEYISVNIRSAASIEILSSYSVVNNAVDYRSLSFSSTERNLCLNIYRNHIDFSITENKCNRPLFSSPTHSNSDVTIDLSNGIIVLNGRAISFDASKLNSLNCASIEFSYNECNQSPTTIPTDFLETGSRTGYIYFKPITIPHTSKASIVMSGNKTINCEYYDTDCSLWLPCTDLITGNDKRELLLRAELTSGDSISDILLCNR